MTHVGALTNYRIRVKFLETGVFLWEKRGFIQTTGQERAHTHSLSLEDTYVKSPALSLLNQTSFLSFPKSDTVPDIAECRIYAGISVHSLSIYKMLTLGLK